MGYGSYNRCTAGRVRCSEGCGVLNPTSSDRAELVQTLDTDDLDEIYWLGPGTRPSDPALNLDLLPLEMGDQIRRTDASEVVPTLLCPSS